MNLSVHQQALIAMRNLPWGLHVPKDLLAGELHASSALALAPCLSFAGAALAPFWSRSCFVATCLPGDLDSQLTLAAVTRPALPFLSGQLSCKTQKTYLEHTMTTKQHNCGKSTAAGGLV